MKIEIEMDSKKFLLGAMLIVVVLGINLLFFGNTKPVRASNSPMNKECQCAIQDLKGGIWVYGSTGWQHLQ